MHGDGCLTALSPADGDRQDKGHALPNQLYCAPSQARLTSPLRLGDSLRLPLTSTRDLQQDGFNLWIGSLGCFEPRLLSSSLRFGVGHFKGHIARFAGERAPAFRVVC